jgi:hypothetical protein
MLNTDPLDRQRMRTIVDRIDKRLKALGLSATEASRMAGLSEDAIRNLRDAALGRKKHKGATVRTLDHLANALETSLDYLLGRIDHVPGGAEAPRTVKVIGFVGAGEHAHFYSDAQGPFDEVTAPEGSSASTVAVEIRGDSLGSFFDRWLVFYDRVERSVTTEMIGKLCIVGLADGRVLIKKIKRSRTRGLFHLLSQTADPITDVEVQWAAPVRAMTPR